MAKKEKEKVKLLDSQMDLEAMRNQLNAKYGANTVIRASEALNLVVRFTPTGCAAIDFGLGGGFAENRMTEVRGPFSSFKSTLALCALANHQKQYKDSIGVYVDAEKSFDPRYARELGCDLRRLLVVNPDSGEQGVDVFTELLSCGRPNFTIIDSIAALVPTAEIEASMDAAQMGQHPRLINRMMRVATARIKRSLYDNSEPPVTVVALNQLREKIGVMFGNPETTPGGKGKDFFVSAIVRLYTSGSHAVKEKVTIGGQSREIRFAQNVSFSVLKNKCSGTQHEEGEFRFHVRPYKNFGRYSFNNAEALLKYGLFFQLVDFTNGVMEYGDLSFKQSSAFIKALIEDEELADKLYWQILDCIAKESGGEMVLLPDSRKAAEDSDDDAVVVQKSASKFKLKLRK